MSMIQENNWVITTKNGKGKLPIFCGKGERLIPIYGGGVDITNLEMELTFVAEVSTVDKSSFYSSIKYIRFGSPWLSGISYDSSRYSCST